MIGKRFLLALVLLAAVAPVPVGAVTANWLPYTGIWEDWDNWDCV